MSYLSEFKIQAYASSWPSNQQSSVSPIEQCQNETLSVLTYKFATHFFVDIIWQVQPLVEILGHCIGYQPRILCGTMVFTISIADKHDTTQYTQSMRKELDILYN